MKLDTIVIGERVRKDMGDIEGLAKSMQRHGLLHPVIVKPDCTLIAGHRRLAAAKALGWKDIPATVIETEDLLAAERDENEARKDFTPTEAVAIGRLIEHEEKNKALMRMKKGASGQIPEGGSESREVIAKAVGMSGKTYERAEAVVTAAEREPQKFGDLPAKMDESNNVAGTLRELNRRKAGLPPDPNFTGKRLPHLGARADKNAPYDPKSSRQLELAEAQKSRLIVSLSTMNGHCRGLDELDLGMAVSVFSKEDFTIWSKKAGELYNSGRHAQNQLGALWREHA